MKKAPTIFMPFTRAQRAVTLLELLAVIMIIGVLSALVVPAFNSMRASSLTQAGNRLADLAALARQNALSRNVITALIVPTDDPELSRRAVAMVEMDSTGGWRQNGAWSIIPAGMAIKESDNSGSPLLNASELALSLRGRAVQSYTALIFYPDGRFESTSGSQAPQITVRYQGDVDKDLSDLTNYYGLFFNADTAAIRIVRL